MPKVGIEQFPYTLEGEASAEEYAEETGQEVIPTYDAGGRTQNIKGYGENPSNLIANGAMTDEEAAKYLNPQATSKHGGKLEATTKYEDGERIKTKKNKKTKLDMILERNKKMKLKKEAYREVELQKGLHRVTSPKAHKTKGKFHKKKSKK